MSTEEAETQASGRQGLENAIADGIRNWAAGGARGDLVGMIADEVEHWLLQGARESLQKIGELIPGILRGEA